MKKVNGNKVKADELNARKYDNALKQQEVNVDGFYKTLHKSKSRVVQLSRQMINDQHRFTAFGTCIDETPKPLGGLVSMLRGMGTFLAEGRRLSRSTLKENRDYVVNKAVQIEKAAAMQRRIIGNS